MRAADAAALAAVGIVKDLSPQVDELGLPSLEGLTSSPAFMSLLRQSCGLESLRQVENLLLGSLCGLWNYALDPQVEDYPESFGQFEAAMWYRYVGAQRAHTIAEMLAERIGNCLTWSFLTGIIIVASGHVECTVRICFGEGHVWVEVGDTPGRIQRIDLANQAHGYDATDMEVKFSFIVQS